VGWAGNGEASEPLPDGGIRRVRKPFNLRDLHAIAGEILASSPPPSPAATAGR
jgi:hypothetical protein